MLQNFQSVNVFSPSLLDIIVNIGVSLVCSFFITFIYRISYRGPGYTDSFVNSIIFLSVITTLVIMVIGNNLARAFGLVGAMSIIRFRTAVKETMDIVYIFFGLAIGMACGVGYHKMAIAGALIIGFVLYLFSKARLFSFKKMHHLLQFSYSNTDELSNYKKTMNEFCKSYDVISIKTDKENDITDYSIYIDLKRKRESSDLVEELYRLPNIKNINIFFADEHI